jgi:two-component system chemotaxis sensor kinase CheA
MWTTVIVQSGDGDVALGVDRLLGTSQVVMHPLPELSRASELIAGASLDVEGHPRLVLAPSGLMHAGVAPPPKASPAPVLPVLIVDDSLTTRMLEQGILASAGYEAHIATSAEQGLEMAASRRYALFLVDVDMPGMDGFGFVRAIRADPALRHIPAILVTSRDAPEDRQRGREAGADHYIVKSEFSQGSFLNTVRRLIETCQAHTS